MTIYTVPGCPACRKARNILKNEAIPYTEENLFRMLLDERITEDVLKQAGYTKGTEYYRQYPSMLARPLIISDDTEKSEMLKRLIGSCRESCQNYQFCAGARNKEAVKDE